MTPEQQERIRLNRERALAKRKAAQDKQAVGDNTQTGNARTWRFSSCCFVFYRVVRRLNEKRTFTRRTPPPPRSLRGSLSKEEKMLIQKVHFNHAHIHIAYFRSRDGRKSG